MRRHLADERGVVTIMVALAMPLIFLLCVFAIDVGNWFVHKRHLQIQADAAALAGGQAYRFPACDNDLIRSAALKYSGKGADGEQYNPPSDVGTPDSRLHAVINGPNYHNQSKPAETDLEDGPQPCDVKFVDVKMTETDLPWFFKAADVDFINAQARVNLYRLTRTSGLLPVGVQESVPRKAFVLLVNEAKVPGDTDYVLGQAELKKGSTAAGAIQKFDSGTTPMPVTLNGISRVGVRLVLSGNKNATACADPISTCNPVTSVCAQNLVRCYDGSSNNGLSLVRGWSQSPSAGAEGTPEARSVELLAPAGAPAACANSYYVADTTTACTTKVKAKVDFPTSSASPPADEKRRVTATFGGNGQPTQLTYQTAGADAGFYTGTLTVPTAGGAHGVTLAWQQRDGKAVVPPATTSRTCGPQQKDFCEGTFGVVHRSFRAQPTSQVSQSGPVATLEVANNLVPGANNLERCSSAQPNCTYSLSVEVGIKGALELSESDDSPVSLRVDASTDPNSTSQNQAIDCDPNKVSFGDELAYGCDEDYKINEGETCPVATALFSSPRPLTCVRSDTGNKTNQVARGLNLRILGAEKPTTCPAAGQLGHNNWPAYPDGDPRIVPLFLVPFGSFTSSGQDSYPILDFAFFYVTGWRGQGGGFANPCEGNGDTFASGVSAQDSGVVSGHFIKRVIGNISGGSSEECDFDAVSGCAAVLTK